ncbi:MAG: hypothetical protein SFW09_01470 [Hyphomicrobiaceae bacterium]|nr:hypothetical protein [Hyphomicrobiaceae bacterium]
MSFSIGDMDLPMLARLELCCLPTVHAWALMVSVAVASPAAAEPACYRDWSDAAPVVVREGLRSARDMHDLARDRLDADVVRITLCQEGAGFVYRLVVRRNDGSIAKWTVSAAASSTP